MGTLRRIVCLANSRKVSGRCIAGKEVLTDARGGWVRPVSARSSGEISDAERRYPDGTSAQVLDVIDIPILGRPASGQQAENCVIDPNERWTRVGAMPRSGLARFLDRPESLWKSGDSTLGGQNDRVRIDAATVSIGSLYLISPERLTLHVVSETAGFVKLRRRVRASFCYGGMWYNWGVTDVVAEKAFLAKSDGVYPLDAMYLCVSLSEMYSDGYRYKLVAAII